MALLIDGDVTTLRDLQDMDSTILETAKHEGIGLEGKVAIATEQVQLEIATFLLRTQAASILPSTTGGYDLSRVVVTPALRRWHTLRVLVEVYSDAYNSQLNDRYLGKWKHFSTLARDASEILFELGVGLVSTPVRKAQRATVTTAGGDGPPETYFVQTAWRGSQGASGAASDIVSYDAAGGELIQVTPGVAPAGVEGWDIYVSYAGEAPLRQNGSPIGLGQTWLLPVTGLVNGIPASEGQQPDTHVRRSKAFF
ncbi:MAG: hypothetical protein R2729_01425 [Bryobacteraceae bacterium]